MQVELVYVSAEQAIHQAFIELNPGATVKEALIHSGIYELYPETYGLPVGIYSKQVGLDACLQPGDRIEIYRPLALDPKEKRRKVAKIRALRS